MAFSIFPIQLNTVCYGVVWFALVENSDCNPQEPPKNCAQEPPHAKTTPWFHSPFPDTTFFFAQSWIFMGVPVGQLFRHAGPTLMCVT
mmetsp:Transcript_62115/g.102534  ORF Transcript_62115/g.102534 Transcript_62115/m.102534 type:complete len:88 (-) Transcript_62115:202-465(-)